MFVDRITNLPHVPRYRAFLDARAMIRNPVRVFEAYRADLGPTFTFHFGGARPAIVSTDPDFIQHVLQKNSGNYHKSDIQVERMAEFQGRGLLNSHGDDWRRQRRHLARGFRRSRMAALLPMQEQVLEESLDRIDRASPAGTVDIYKVMVELTLRLVGKALFGRPMTDGELEQIAGAISEIQAFMVRQIIRPYMIPWFRMTGQSARYQRLRVEAEQVVRDRIAVRLRTGDQENDLLRRMLDTPYEDSGECMSPEQVLIESLQLMVAGNETSSVALSWTFYLLGRHPRFIGLVREEVDAVFGTDPITFSGLHSLRLTLQVLDEAMRLYPSFWMIDRVALRDDEVQGIGVPAGTTVVPYIYGTHRNPGHWTDPETFDPSRFEKEARKCRHPYAHIPYGGGPRTCIGSNMAIMQMLLVLAGFVRRYDFELVASKPVEIDPMMILRPKGVIRMRVRRRR